MKSVCVKVPASTANLGPGFDCLGIALKIYNEVVVRRGDGDSGPMIAAAGTEFFRRARMRPFGFECAVGGDVPRSRGLGSSVTVRLGVLHGLNALADDPLSRDEIFSLCADLEGHPDNAAPAAFGGFTIARPGAEVLRYRVKNDLSFGLLIPDFKVATRAARRVLPRTVPLRDAAVSGGNACAIAAAFASRNYEKLAGCFDDHLHQPYREKLVPCLTRVIEAGRMAGALGGWLSGSGSTIACAITGPADQAARVAQAMLDASGLPGARTLITKADNTGVRVSVGP